MGIVVILFTIGFTPYLAQEAFATHVISSYVANDPDDGDTVFGIGDTLTITLDVAGNVTTGAVTVPTDVTGNFTFTANPLATFTTDWTANWINTTQLQITFVTNPTALTIGASTVEATAGNNIGDGSGDEGLTTAQSTLSGDFGLFVAASTGGGGGCTGDCIEPTLGVRNDGQRIVEEGFTYNGNSVDVERYFTPYPLVTVNVGKQNVAEFKIYDNGGPDKISHFELAFGLANGESIGMSKAVINWDKTFDGIETVTLDDPENVLDKIDVTTSEGSCSDELHQKCLIVKVTHTFRAPLEFDILATNVWDEKRNAWQNYYNHGIEVVGESQNQPKEYAGVNAGQIYHLTETSKTMAIDEFGNTWSLVYDQWAMDFVPNQKIVDGIAMNGYTRENSQFDVYRYGQYLLAENKLSEMCSECSDESYAEINDIFAYEYPITISSLENPEIQKTMIIESEKAQEILAHMFDPILYLK